MENTSDTNKSIIEGRRQQRLSFGLLAHVDAGKTTLSESILYTAGAIRNLGRVDNQNAFLDTHELEKARGITIFSKQARFMLGEKAAVLLDTPGHVDFSAEMERVLWVLDYAVLVISGADGVQGHVETLWRLLKRYHIPVFLFINKMDQPGTDKAKILEELQKRLDSRCIDFDESQPKQTFYENVAVCDETVLETYLETDRISEEDITKMICRRKLFPCFFGSALKMDGIQEFFKGLEQYTVSPKYPETFGARVYKIARDDKGNRLTYMKITGGSLKVKMPVSGLMGETEEKNAQEGRQEKIEQIRLYSGASFKTAQEISAGEICAVTGLSQTFAGQGLGLESVSKPPALEPVMTYRISLPDGINFPETLVKLRQLEEEIPELKIEWNESLGELYAQVMGEVQIEILTSLIKERFHIDAVFDSGNIVYKETIQNTVEGVGHFEPLRHYAEVHLKMEPGPRGSGLVFETECSEDMLDRNWQRLILTHLKEKQHKGVLTGSEITDIKITLIAGRAHQKHTEGGDFRQATYRAVRHGLKQAKSLLLEPVYEFCLEIPQENTGRAIADIQKMHGDFSPPEMANGMAVISGWAPVALMRKYQSEVTAYTKGRGHLNTSLKGYEPCHNADEVIEALGYDSEKDADNPTGSVFCAHGAGFVVPWDKVTDYMHIEAMKTEREKDRTAAGNIHYPREVESAGWADEKELEEIFTRTYGPVKRDRNRFNRSRGILQRENAQAGKSSDSGRKQKAQEDKKEYLLVDGYNIIFAWEELKQLAEVNIDSARTKLMDILCNYQGFKKNIVILVFDAYRVEGHPGEISRYKNIFVVYTKEAETADQYIEKTVHEIGRKHHVTVATSDALEQVIILGQGAKRVSACGLKDDIEAANIQMRNEYMSRQESGGHYLLSGLSEEEKALMEDVRLGQKKFGD